MRFGLTDEVIDQINSVFIQYPQASKVILYGSRAKGNYRPGSDIDITLMGDNLDLSLLNKIGNDIDDLLTPYKFDISSFDSINNEDLIDHINRVGTEFYIKK